jgi:hypothetical protein
LGARQLVHGGNEIEVLVDREVFVEGKPLRHVTDAALELLGLLGNPEAEHFDLARGRQQQSAQHSDRRRLARAVRAQKPIHLRAADIEVEVVDRDDIAEPCASNRVRGSPDRCLDDHCQSSCVGLNEPLLPPLAGEGWDGGCSATRSYLPTTGVA